MDEIQLAVSPSLVDIKYFKEEDLNPEVLNNYKQKLLELQSELKEAKSNPLMTEQDIAIIQKELKSLKHPSYLEAVAYKDLIKSTADIGHLDDYYYVTNNNVAITAFENGIKKAVNLLNIKVDLGIAWNSGKNWLIFGLGL